MAKKLKTRKRKENIKIIMVGKKYVYEEKMFKLSSIYKG